MNKTIGDLSIDVLKQLHNTVFDRFISVAVDVFESGCTQLVVVVDDDTFKTDFLDYNHSLSMSEYDKLMSDILNHFKPVVNTLPLKRFLVITPSSDKPYNMEYLYEGELLANYAETYDYITKQHNHNKELTKFVEEAQPGDVYVIKWDEYEGKGNKSTIMRINDKYE